MSEKGKKNGSKFFWKVNSKAQTDNCKWVRVRVEVPKLALYYFMNYIFFFFFCILDFFFFFLVSKHTTLTCSS